MKKILIILLTIATLLKLSACDQSVTNVEPDEPIIVDDDPLVMYVNAKNRAEYFMVKQYTPVSEFNPEDIIEVNLNKELDYTVEWVGERLSNQLDTYDEILNVLGDNPLEEVESSKKDTLDCEGFRPISIYISVDHNGRKITKRVDTILLVAPEKLYKDLQEQYPDLTRIEDAYIAMNNIVETYETTDYGFDEDGTEKSRTKYILETYKYVSNISTGFFYDY